MPGTWQPLANQPTFAASTMLLLTDGTVMCQEENSKNWWRLAPNAYGDYVQGTWSPLASMKNSRLYYASAVLADGRVFVAGGEYSDAGSDTKTAEVYDPVLNYWTSIPAPPGWNNIGDAPCCVLPDGKVLLGSIFSTDTVIYDPRTNTWATTGSKDDNSSEETWTLLPDETVLNVECTNHPRAEKYVAPAGNWVSAGSTPVDLVQASSIEIGPALLLPDGRVFAIGATGHTALYTPPPLANQPGTWVAGPDFPTSNGSLMKAKDAPACLLPNGNVLCAVGPGGDTRDEYPQPTHFFEFDGSSLNSVPDPPNSGTVVYEGRMLLLPTGQVLFSNGTKDIEVYTADGAPEEDWRPEITNYPSYVRIKQTYRLHGRLLNGLSQAVSYGDDASMATNYPLVRIRNLHSGRVWYCRTFDHSTMGVATGLSIQATSFKVPWGVEYGPTELCVVANGIASECVRIYVAPYQFHFQVNEGLVNHLIGSLADGPLWVLGPHGPVPVDPWGPRVRERAQEAYKDIIQGIRALQTLGREVTEEHHQAAIRSSKAPAQPSGARRRQ